MRKGTKYLGIVAQREIADTNRVEERFYFNQQRPKVWMIDEYRLQGYALFTAYRDIPPTAVKRKDRDGITYMVMQAEISEDTLRRRKSKQEFYQKKADATKAQAEEFAAAASTARANKLAAAAAAKPAAKKAKKAATKDMTMAEVLASL